MSFRVVEIATDGETADVNRARPLLRVPSRDAPFSTHGRVEKLATPGGFCADRDLSLFHQQEAQQRVSLLADVSLVGAYLHWTPPTAPAPLAGDLLAATKTFR